MIGTYSRDSVTWLKFEGLDEYGDPDTPTEVALQCRVEWRVRRVLNHAGEEVISSGHIKMAEKPKAGQDKIRITGTDHIIVAVLEAKSFSRVSHYEVYLQ